MKFAKILVLFLLFSAFLLVPPIAYAQYGKNQVVWEKTTWNFYQSTHFKYYFSVDITNEEVLTYFRLLNQHMERSYEFLSAALKHDLQRKSIVVVTRTHSQFEALRIHGDPFMPEGVNAFAYPREGKIVPGSDLVLVVKADADMHENLRTYTHELVHHFEFDAISRNFFQKTMNMNPVPHWLMEGVAEYLADMFLPSPGGLDLRTMIKRLAAMNVRNSQFDGLPTLYQLHESEVDVYAFGPMVLRFLEARYGRDSILALISSLLSDRNQEFEELVADLSNGELATPEDFDREHRKYWESQFDQNMSKYSQAYDKTENFDGRQIIKRPYPLARIHPVPSPDGQSVAFFQVDPRYLGIVLAVAPALSREDPPYVPMEKRKKTGLFGKRIATPDPEPEVLTKFLPFKPYEYLIIGLEPGLDWWQDTNWARDFKESSAKAEKIQKDTQDLKDGINILNLERNKTKDKNARVQIEDKINVDRKKIVELEKENALLDKALSEMKKIPDVSKIVFFARKNRDHALFILDANKRRIIRNFEIPLPLDQAFSPVFSPDGQQVYFSASSNINRHIYAVDLRNETFRQVTGSESVYAQSPAISPDGAKLAYSAFVKNFKKLFVLDLATGTQKQLTFGRYNDEAPSWSPDGTKIIYVSDEIESAKNLYTLDMASGVASQWTNFPGGVFAPRFMPGENDRIVYTAFEENQFLSYIFRAFKLFDVRLKKPLRIFEQKETGETMELAFRSQETISEELDQRQLENPQPSPARWKFYGTNITFGSTTYWGMFASSQFVVQDLLANRTHLGIFAQYYGSKYIDYTYLDRSRRWGLAANVNHNQYPVNYLLYNFQFESPRYPYPDGDNSQFIINNTWVKETSATLYAEYPFNKWDRIEFGVRPRKRTYFMPLSDAGMADLGDQIPEIDRQFYDFYKASNGQTNVGLTAAFVHDTVLNNTLGPLHGDAVRAEVEYGPGLNKGSSAYLTAQVDARKYFRLYGSSLFAVHGISMASNRPNGDVALFGGSDTLRAYPYFSVAGNQVGYGSAELRFPIADVALFGVIPFPLRGVFFGDYAVVRFSDDLFPARREWSYGIGLQAYIFLPMNFEWAKTKFAPDKWTFNFRIGFNF